jgi:regulator of sirC expression with transglutaminase-like and TPR domain
MQHVMASSPPPESALRHFAALVGPGREDESIPLAEAALAIARIEYPNLDPAPYLARLDEIAQQIQTRMRKSPTARESMTLLNRVLFDEAGLRGNREDFYDPRNSFLNDVLDRKLGIPITLSVVYMEVARRVGFPVAGVGMPGHFLLKHYDVIAGEIFIDAFNRGTILSPTDCQQRLEEVYGGPVDMRAEYLQPVTHREILTRMLNNLRQIYLTQQDGSRGLAVLDLLLAIPPGSPDLLRERAWLRLNLDQYIGAAQDLGKYLKLAPEAADAAAVRETFDMVRRMVARLN